MPSKNTIRSYIENGYYHIYNRGVEKRRIFLDADDYKRFILYLKLYLSPIESLTSENAELRGYFIKNNLFDQLELLAFCLMPNHFHLLMRQKNIDSITKFMQRLSTAYTMYFNMKYDRVGSLFQGRYKACIVENDEYLLHLSRYIHLNPHERGVSLFDFPWSSYSSFIGNITYEWLKPQFILNYFSKNNDSLTYKSFVEDSNEVDHEINHLTID